MNNLPDFESVSLEIPEANLKLDNWMDYSLERDWTSANAAWHVSIADGNYKTIINNVRNRMKVYFKINNTVQATGFVEHIGVSSNERGVILTISGRDCLALASNSCIDIAKFTFADTETIKDVAKKILAPFGFTNVLVDDRINRQKLTGKTIVFDYNSELEKLINSPLNKKYRPRTSEGVYQFLERLGKRFGFHAWSSSDGTTVYCGTPDFKSKPIYNIYRYKKDISPELTYKNNVKSADFKFSTLEQPTIVIAMGSAGGGSKRYHPIKAIRVNELLVADPPPKAIKDVLDSYVKAGAKILPRNANIKVPSLIEPNEDKVILAILVDDMNLPQTQLNNFVNTSMANFQSKCVNITYTVAGLSQDNVIWTPNTQVNVYDEVLDIYQTLWIKKVSFNKNRTSGSTTSLECLLPYTMDLYPQAD